MFHVTIRAAAYIVKSCINIQGVGFRMESKMRGALVIVASWALTSCGGGGGDGGLGGGGQPGGSSGYTRGVFAPASTFANQCASPRPNTVDRSGSTFTQNMFLRSWTNNLYLWYSEVPDISPSSYSTAEYFDLLQTSQLTQSGRRKDRFHFTYSTEDWEALSESGIELGYGAQWLILASRPPRKIVVAFVEPGTPAATLNVLRGAEVLSVDGVDVRNAGSQAATAQINAAFFPAAEGETHTFTISESGAPRIIQMTSAAITHTPVLISTTIPQQDGLVGYLLFNDHIATAEGQLINAVNALSTAGIRDLILDLRYNGGGYLDIANELGYMIAGTMATGRTFERLVFNDKHTTTDPVTGRALAPTPFYSTAVGIDENVTAGTQLPRLNLPQPRVYIITGNNTCSASESIINSLRGIDVDVYQIGSTTCGKPYGFYPQNNCGTTYFSIQFEGRNAEDFGNYPDGFTPQNSSDAASVELPGCAVPDDFTRQLGDPAEGRLAAALAFRANNNSASACPAAASFAPIPGVSSKQAISSSEGVMHRSPARENRILRN